MGVYVRAYATYVSSMLTHPHSQVNCNRNLQPQNEGGEKRKSRIPIRMSQRGPDQSSLSRASKAKIT